MTRDISLCRSERNKGECDGRGREVLTITVTVFREFKQRRF